ncbi:MAG: hypothetical protein J2O46_03465 [Nocardioides sp.]|nr:hypothetical protein [Nocardioides sp.]
MDNRAVRAKLRDQGLGNRFGEPISMDHRAIYADAVVEILLEAGLDHVTMGAVARHLKQAPSAVSQMAEGKKGFFAMVVGRFTGRWIRWVTQPDYDGAVRLRLPIEDDEVHGVRVWSALRELAAGEARAGDPRLAEHVAEARNKEQMMLRIALRGRGIEVQESVLTALTCLADGLRTAVADPVAPLAPETAQEIATLVTERLCGAEATTVTPQEESWPGSPATNPLATNPPGGNPPNGNPPDASEHR